MLPLRQSGARGKSGYDRRSQATCRSRQRSRDSPGSFQPANRRSCRPEVSMSEPNRRARIPAIALNVVWTRPPALDALPDETRRPARHRFTPWLLSLCLALLWGFWVVGFMRLFWPLAVALLLPPAIKVAQMASHHVSRSASGSGAPSAPGLTAVFLDRGLRALLIAGTALLLAHTLQIDLVEMTGRDTLLTRLLRGALSSVVILLVADLIWQVVKSLIDRRLSQAEALSPPGTEAAVRQARLRTLLPIFRNVIFVVLAVVAVMMALSALGVEIRTPISTRRRSSSSAPRRRIT